MECDTDLGLKCFETLSYHFNGSKLYEGHSYHLKFWQGFPYDPQLISSRNVFSTKSLKQIEMIFCHQTRGGSSHQSIKKLAAKEFFQVLAFDKQASCQIQLCTIGIHWC